MPRSGSNTLTMVPSAPLACLLVSSLILFISFMSVPAVSGQTTFQYDNILLYRADYDMKKCSYHFSTKTYGEVADGEFYFTTSGKLVANNVGQLGIKDLGRRRSQTSTRLFDARAKRGRQPVHTVPNKLPVLGGKSVRPGILRL